MARSYIEYTGDGVTTQFAVPFAYISQDHVHAAVNGEEVELTWINSGTVEIDPAPADQAYIKIYRQSSPDARLVDYNVPGTLTEEDLDNDSLQAFYLAQEAVDIAESALIADLATGQFDANGRRIVNLGDPEDAQDAATKAYGDANWGGAAAATAVSSAATAVNAAQAAANSASAAHDAQLAAEAAAAAVAVGDLHFDEFTGDGITVEFTLGREVMTIANTQVYLDGVYQNKDTYTVEGDKLTFSVAPANGVRIEVVTGGVQDIGVPSDDTVSTQKLQAGAVTEEKIEDSVLIKSRPQLGTKVSLSGTSTTITGIPSWAKRITVLIKDASTNGTSPLLIQLGTASGYETSGYLGATSSAGSSTEGINHTAGIGLTTNTQAATNIRHGAITLYKFDDTNKWIASGIVGLSDVGFTYHVGYSKELSGTLNRLRFRTENGTDTMDAGEANIQYE